MRLSELLVSEATEYEFKSALEVAKAKSWLKTVGAFSNGLGGSIYFGVDDAGEPEGLEDIQRDTAKISQLIHSKIVPMVSVVMTPYDMDGKRILRVEVKPGIMTPYYYSSDGNKIAYVRMGEESVQAPPHILNELILKGQNQSFDAMFSKYAKADLSFSVFEATYRMKARKKVDESDYVSFKLADEAGKLTYAGVFVSDQCPLLQSRVFCTRWNGLKMGSVFDDALDDKEYEGNIFSLLDNTKQFIKNNSKVRWKKTPNGRIDMPDYEADAIHEAVVNSLVHRSYLRPGTEVHVDMYDNRIEIVSPGGMFSGKKIQELDLWNVPSERRNPVLADLFQRMRLMERRGSGIKKILEIYEGQKQPEFRSTETDFVTTFYNENYEKEDSKSKKEDCNREKQDYESKKQDCNQEKQDFEEILRNLVETKGTTEKIKAVLIHFSEDTVFGRKDIAKLLEITKSPASVLLQKMLKAELIIPVEGYGRGKYRIK